MTGTEMFDAIAHIDEDLIEGCLARMKARASERRALAAAEALTENEKKSSPFKRAALTFGAIAAAVVIMLGLISILHIGGKSPAPVEPVVTDSPEPTEDAYALPAPADNSSISVSEGPRAVFVQDGRLYALFGDNTDNVFGDVDTVLEAYSPADGAEEMLFYAVKVPQLIETDVMQAVLFASGTREEYFVAEGTPFACLLFVKTDGSLWVRGSNPGGMFGSADTQNGVKLYDNVKKVFVGERCVFALTENGDYLKWSHDAASDGSSPVLVASGVADGGGDNFYLTEGGRLYADNGENSAVLAENVRSFAVDGNKVIAVLEDGSAKLFTFEMGSMYSGKLSFTEDEYIETGVAYCGISGSAVFVVKEDGALLSPGGYYAWSSGWSRSLDNVVSAYASGGSIYAITEDGTLHRIDPDVTIAQNVSFCRPMAGSEGCLYVTKDGALHRYSPSGGTEDIALPAETLPVRSTDTVAEEILSVPVKWYSYDELSENHALGNEMTYLESIEDMEMVHYSPDAFLVTDDGEIAIVDTVGARLCVYDLASGQLKKSVQVGQILEADPVRAAKYDGVYYVLIPYSDSRIVAVYPDGTTSEIPVPQLQGMLEYCRVSEYYAEDGRLILTLIGPDLIMTKAVSLSDGSVTSLYSTQWTLENDTFTVTRNGMIWSFPAEPSSGVRSTRIDVLKVGENGELYVIQEVPIEGQDDMGLYQIYDKDGRLLRCEKIDYFMDSYMTADGGRIVGPDDYLYEMHCDEDAVRIIRIVPAEQTAGTEPMTLGGGHTANFTYADKLIFVDFELPEGYELRTEKGDETKLPLNISPDTGGYIYSADGRLVGCFTAYTYDEEASDDEIGRIYAEFLSGHWHIMLDEMYEPIAEHGAVHPALTLSEGVEVIGGQAMGENPRFTCDALIAFDTASHTKLELAFLQGELDRGQLTYIAESIALSAEDRSAPKPTPRPVSAEDEALVEAAWSIASRISELHGLGLKKDAYSISKSRLTVSFSDDPDNWQVSLSVDFAADGNGEYRPYVGSCLLDYDLGAADVDYEKWQADASKLAPLWGYAGYFYIDYAAMGFEVTADELRANGYDVSAAGAADHTAQTIAKMFRELEEGNYFRCKTSEVAEFRSDGWGDVLARFVFLPENPVIFSAHFGDITDPLYENAAHPEYEGFINFTFWLRTTELEDGSFLVTVSSEDPSRPSERKLVLSDFSDSSELIAVIRPGEGENELCYSRRSNGGGYDGGPASFSVSDGKLWIWDPYKYPGELAFQSLFVYDIETGEGTRVKAPEYSDMERCCGLTVIGNKVIRHESVFDLASGEATPFGGEIEYFGSCFEDEKGIYGFLRKGYYELLIRLDEDGWTGESILAGIAPADEGWEKWTLSENEVSLYAPENAYLCGRGADGSYFLAVNNPVSLGKVEVVGEASWYVFLRYGADGELISAVSPDIAHEKWSDESEEYFIFAADGCFYYMYVFEDRTEFYRITL